MLPRLSKQYAPSHFWERNVRPFDAALDELSRRSHLTLDDVWTVASRFPQEPPVRFGGPVTPLDLRFRNLRYWLHRNGVRRMSARDAEHMVALFVLSKLKRKGMLGHYEKLRRRIGAESSMLLARHYCYARLIEDYRTQVFGDARPLRVLEIGGGAGMFARVLHARGLVEHYYDVDLPEILLSASLTLSHSLPNERLRFVGRGLPGDEEPQATFNFCPAQHFDAVPRGAFDLIVNISSFQEMDNEVRDRYLRSMRDLAARPAILFNANRWQELPQADGTTRLNHPLLYPYDPAEEVLAWGIDLIQDAVRLNAGAELFVMPARSFTIMRASVLR